MLQRRGDHRSYKIYEPNRRDRRGSKTSRAPDNLEGPEVLFYDGTILRVGKTSDVELEQIILAKAQDAARFT
jgi:hypothetical protein